MSFDLFGTPVQRARWNAVAVPSKPATVRHFFKCSDCLTPMAVDADSAVRPANVAAEALCACGGRMTYMGRVERSRVVASDHRCPCDERCTGATGPSCECSCGGENHGTGRVVEVLRDMGGIPRFQCPADAFKRAEEFRLARELARERFKVRWSAVEADKRAGRWVSSEDYYGWRAAVTALDHAEGLRTHAGRMRALEKLSR